MDIFKRTFERNLLKYSAGHAVFCPHCHAIAGYRHWVIAESSTGANMWQGCSDCFEAVAPDAAAKGWSIIREPEKKKRAPVFNSTLEICGRDGKALKTVPASYAFRAFGHCFWIHQSINRPGFTVSHADTGAAVAYGKTKAATIRAARAKLDEVGEARFSEILARFPANREN